MNNELVVDEDTGEVLNFLSQEEDSRMILDIDQSFMIDDYDKCLWYISRINEYKQKTKHLEKQYKAMLKEIETGEKSVKYLFEKQFITEIWKHIPKGKKSLKTLAGTAKFKECKATVEIDEAETISKEFIIEETKIVEKIDKEALIKAFEAGQSPDGARYIPARDSLSIS